MKTDMYCNTCRVVYTIRATPFDAPDDHTDMDFDPEADLSADYCPFCGQLAEED
jgi:hypothetical protein